MNTQMKRRQFLAGTAALGTAGALVPAAKPAAQTVKKNGLTVSDVQMLQVKGNDNRTSLYCKISTKEGVEGFYGPVDADAGLFVDRYFRKPLLGQDPLAHEAYWDRMFRAHRHARGSHYLMGLSAVDNALWDLKGRYFGVPVYRLLGGNRDRVRVYASALGLSQEPEAMQAKARELKQEGFRHQKWFLRDRGAKHGPEGLDLDVEVVRLLREAVGYGVDLMFDAFSTWDYNHAAAWAKRVEQYVPRWIEEPFPTANIDAFVELAHETTVPIATGEHFYNRWDVHNFLQAGAISVVQADPEWCGGVSELVKMCTLASVHGAHVVPHGHSIHAAMHIVASQPEEVCPLVEYLLNKMGGNYYYFEKHRIVPEGGLITLPEEPGFGIELDESKIADLRPVHWNRT